MTTESAVDECEQCDGARVIPVRRCQPACNPIRGCAPDCPSTRLVACPTCQRRDLGEDLNS